MTWTPEERETIVRTSDADDLVYIWTAQRKHITRLRKDARFAEVRTGQGFAEFTIPADQWSPAGAKRRVSQSSAVRIAATERLLKAREAQNAGQ